MVLGRIVGTRSSVPIVVIHSKDNGADLPLHFNSGCTEAEHSHELLTINESMLIECREIPSTKDDYSDMKHTKRLKCTLLAE